MQPQVYCIHCDKITPYDTTVVTAFDHTTRLAFCKECGSEVYISSVDAADAAARETVCESFKRLQRRNASSDADISPTIQTLKPNPTEAIVLTFDARKVTLKNAAEYVQYVKSAFPDNVVLALPDYISLHSCSKDVLENYISLIASVIDEEL